MRFSSLFVLALALPALAAPHPDRVRRNAVKKCSPKTSAAVPSGVVPPASGGESSVVVPSAVPSGSGMAPSASSVVGSGSSPSQAASGSASGSSPSASAGAPCSCTTPKTVVLDGARLVDLKKQLEGEKAKSSDTAQHPVPLTTVLENLVVAADRWLTQGPWTVTSKKAEVPNGIPQDYASQAPYWWPANWDNPSSTVKCPYVQRDGERNPEVDEFTDRRDGSNMMNASYTLSLAWWYTGKAEYREHAGKVLRTWFIDEATKMTPHLEHAQLIPCKFDGRETGIIDFSQQYTDVLDAVAILATTFDSAWSKADDDAFRAWNTEFLAWLQDSDFGKKVLEAKNNHFTFAAMCSAGIAAYLEQYDVATKMFDLVLPRIDKDIAANGSQPAELSRTTSWHYTTFNLVAYTRMCAIGKLPNVAVDMWGYKGPEGQSVQKAIEFIAPYAAGKESWPYPELHFNRYAAYDDVRFGADWGLQEAVKATPDLEVPPGGVMWDLRPASEQLDSILGNM